MLKKLCISLIIILMAAIFAVPFAFGATCEIETDRNTGRITLSGKIDMPLQIVSVEVFKPDKSKTDFGASDSGNASAILDFLGQTVADGDGNYSFSYISEGPSDEYSFSVGNSASSELYTSDFYFISPIEFATVFNTVNTTDSATVLCGIIKNSYRMFGLTETDMAGFLAMSETLQNKISAYIINIRNDMENKVFVEYTDFVTAFYDALFLHNVNVASESDLPALIDGKTDYWTGYYAALDEKGKENVLGNISKSGELASISSLKKIVNQSTLLYAFSTLSHWGDVKAFLIANNDGLELDLSKYSLLADTSETDKKIVGKLYTSTQSLQQAINDSFLPQGGDDYSSAGSSSGGGGGGGTRVYNITTTPEEKEDNSSDVIQTQPADDNVFKDIADVPWAIRGITALYNSGVINGKDKDNFAPNDTITREEFVKILVCAFGIYDAEAECSFLDAAPQSWYSSYIGSAVDKGIINGIGENTFGIGAEITRQDIAVIICRAKGLSNSGQGTNAQTSAFADWNETADYARQSLAEMVAIGVINGVSDTQLMPKMSATRAQAVMMIYRFMQTEEFKNNNLHTEQQLPIVSPETSLDEENYVYEDEIQDGEEEETETELHEDEEDEEEYEDE